MQNTLSHGQFQTLIDQTIQLHVNDTILEAKITEVNALTRHGDAEREPFSIILVTNDPENHGQQVYRLEHLDLGQHDLFLVPLGPFGDGMSYEAVFT